MIVCFSGTGNSRYVAGLLADVLGEEILALNRRFLDDGSTAALRGRVVWVFPVYSWGVPPVMLEAIARYARGDAENYAVATCGDDVGKMPDMLRRAFMAKGAYVRGIWSVIMPNNYVAMKGFDVDSDEVASAKIAAAPGRVASIAREIAAGVDNVTDVTAGKFAWLKTWVVYPWFVKHAMLPKKFHAGKNCVGCGLCAKVCPMENIEMENAHPCWSDRCAFCLACYHACPHHAVAYGHATEGKGRYDRLIFR